MLECVAGCCKCASTSRLVYNILLRGTFCCPGVGQPNTSVHSAVLPSCTRTRCAGKAESDVALVGAKICQQSVRCRSVEFVLEATCLCETAHGHAGMKRVVVFAEKKLLQASSCIDQPVDPDPWYRHFCRHSRSTSHLTFNLDRNCRH